MDQLKRLEHWHKCIKPEKSKSELMALYHKLLLEEIKEYAESVELLRLATDIQRAIDDDKPTFESIGNMVKELADIKVVSAGLIEATNNQTSHVVEYVNDSNFSKLVQSIDLTSTQNYFKELGIEVYSNQVDTALFGFYSKHDQTVNGKFYAKDKLLKSPNYCEVHEEVFER